MIKAQYFVYTRNRDIDYRTFYSPSEELCPRETRKKFLKEIRGVIDIETYDDPLDSPRWLYSCSNGLLLFGVGTMNNELSETYNVDFANRPVRGFFGIVLPYLTSEVCLPMDINLFSHLYKQYIEPIWELDRDHFNTQTIEVDLNEFINDGIHVIYPTNNGLSLNYHDNKCVILGDIKPEDAFSNALTLGHDISIVTGFNNKKHAYSVDSEYKYMNVIVKNVIEREEKNFSTEQSGFHYDKPSIGRKSQQEIVEQPKKVLSPKLIYAIGLLIIIVLLWMIWPKSCRDSQTIQSHSVSGDTIQVKKNI